MNVAPMAPGALSAAVARRYAIGVVLFAGVYAAITNLMLNTHSLRTTVARFVALVLLAILVARGVRWARVLFALFAGLVAPYAVLLAFIRPMPLGWRAVFAGYGIGTLWCLWGLFRQPAAAHFAPTSVANGGV